MHRRGVTRRAIQKMSGHCSLGWGGGRGEGVVVAGMNPREESF